jgi:hypothetical protein
MLNYNPHSRLHAFVPQAARGDVRTDEKRLHPVKKARLRTTRPESSVIVIVHAVDMDVFYKEFRTGYMLKSVCDMCDVVASWEGDFIAFGEAKTSKLAEAQSATFGTGNLMVYALANAPNAMPQYIALGVTAGCAVDGLALRGKWTLLTAFGGSKNPFTHAAIERSLYDSVFMWSTHPSKKTLASFLLRRNFAKKFLPKVWSTYAEVVAARAAGTLEYTPETRAVLLLELLFTSSEASKRLFLHHAGSGQSTSS